NIATNFSDRANSDLPIRRSTFVKQLHHGHDHVDHWPGRSNEDDSKHHHFFGAFARGLDQIFATQVVTAEVAVLVRPVAVPSASTSMEKKIGSRKSIFIEPKVRLHGVRYSSDRSTSQRLIQSMILSCA